MVEGTILGPQVLLVVAVEQIFLENVFALASGHHRVDGPVDFGLSVDIPDNFHD